MKKSLGPKIMAVPTPVWCIGSYDSDGIPNLMTAAWGGVCCSQPPCLTVSLQKARHTYANILLHGGYTINIPSTAFAYEADYVGIGTHAGDGINKFKELGLTDVRGDFVDAPYVEEFPLIIECKLVQTVELGIHTQFIGEIVDVKVNEEMLTEKGLLDIEKIDPMIFTPGARTYHSVGDLVGNAFSIGMSKKGK